MIVIKSTMTRDALELENEALRNRVTQLEASNAHLQSTNGALTTELDRRAKEIASYQHKLDQMIKRLFGRSAEKVDPAQLELAFREAVGEPAEVVDPAATALASEAPDDEETAATKRERRVTKRRRLPEHLPLEDRHVYPEVTSCCGEPMKDAGVEIVEVLDFEPASYKRVRIVKHKSACVVKNHNVVRAAAIEEPFKRASIGSGMLAQVITAKYADHTPLNRQVVIAKRFGVDLEKSTMCGWLAEAAFALTPVHREIKRLALSSSVLHVDDTPITIQDRTAPGGSRRGYLWAYHGEQGDVFFEYTPHRKRDGPAGVLENYRGYVVADAYSGFDGLFVRGSSRIEVGCWAHARRRFFEAIQTETAAASAIGFIRNMYLVEAELKLATVEERLAARRDRTTPILAKFKEWLDANAKTVLPKTPLGDAIGYTVRQWEALTRFVQDGRLPLDNNVVERDLRGVAVGRANWLFAGSDEGAKRAAVFLSLIQTCRVNKVEPFHYLRDVFDKLGSTSQNRVFDLTPRGWNAVRAAKQTADATA